jgi:ankyrin repeat protein
MSSKINLDAVLGGLGLSPESRESIGSLTKNGQLPLTKQVLEEAGVTNAILRAKIVSRIRGAPAVQQKLPDSVAKQIAADRVQEASVWVSNNAHCLEAMDPRGRTALMIAASSGANSCLSALISAGADVHAKLSNGASAVFIASQEGHANAVRILLQAGADVNAKMGNGATPLLISAVTGHAACAKVLLEHRADPGLQTITKDSPWKMAKVHGHKDILDLLHEHGWSEPSEDGGRNSPTRITSGGRGSPKREIRHSLTGSMYSLEAAALSADTLSFDYRANLLAEGLLCNRMYRGRYYISCVAGHDLVDYVLHAGRATTRATALSFARGMLSAGIIQQASTEGNLIEQAFADSDCLYQVTQKPQSHKLDESRAQTAGVSSSQLLRRLNGSCRENSTPITRKVLTPRESVENALEADVIEVEQTETSAVFSISILLTLPGRMGADSSSLEQVTAVSHNWVVKKRYSEFKALHQAVVAHLGEPASELGFPDKNILKYFQTIEVLESRRIQLNYYVQKLLQMLEADIFQFDRFGNVQRPTVPCAATHTFDLFKAFLDFVEVGPNVVPESPLGNASPAMPGSAGPAAKGGPLSILQACSEGKAQLLEILLTNGDAANLHGTGDGRKTALHECARWGEEGCMTLLLKAGADVRVRMDGDGCTPALLAAMHGNLPCLKALVTIGGADTALNDGCSALYAACFTGHAGMTKLLLNAGACAYTPVENGDTPVHVAARNGHSECLQLLLSNSHGAVEDERRESYCACTTLDGVTPLHAAAASGHEVCLRVLLAAATAATASSEAVAAAAPSTPRRGGRTSPTLPTSESHGSVQTWPVQPQPPASVQEFIELTTPGGKTAMHAAAETGSAACIKVSLLRLLCCLVSCVHTNVAGSFVVWRQHKRGHRHWGKSYVVRCAGDGCAQRTCVSCIYVRVFSQGGHTSCVRQLLATGCQDICILGDADIRISGCTAMDIALMNNHEDTAAVLQGAGAVAPVMLPETLVNKRVDVEGIGQGTVTAFFCDKKQVKAGVSALSIKSLIATASGGETVLAPSGTHAIQFQHTLHEQRITLLRGAAVVGDATDVAAAGLPYRNLDCPMLGPATSFTYDPTVGMSKIHASYMDDAEVKLEELNKRLHETEQMGHEDVLSGQFHAELRLESARQSNRNQLAKAMKVRSSLRKEKEALLEAAALAEARDVEFREQVLQLSAYWEMRSLRVQVSRASDAAATAVSIAEAAVATAMAKAEAAAALENAPPAALQGPPPVSAMEQWWETEHAGASPPPERASSAAAPKVQAPPPSNADGLAVTDLCMRFLSSLPDAVEVVVTPESLGLFFSKYDPAKSKPEFVDEILRSYSGHKMLQRLVRMYSDLPAFTLAMSTSTAHSIEIEAADTSDVSNEEAAATVLLDKLNRFYGIHNPAKLTQTGKDSVKTLAQWGAVWGREPTLEAALVKEYGVGLESLPSAPEPVADQEEDHSEVMEMHSSILTINEPEEASTAPPESTNGASSFANAFLKKLGVKLEKDVPAEQKPVDSAEPEGLSDDSDIEDPDDGEDWDELIEELQEFYGELEPSKAAVAEELVMENDIRELAQALKLKYGKVPPGWERHL